MSNEIPRRARIDLFTPAEKAIYAAVQAVESAGCDVRLTHAVNKLSEARALVADFVDGVPFGEGYPRDEASAKAERARVVQWLRLPDLGENVAQRTTLNEAAAEIENGAHESVPMGPITRCGVEVSSE